MVCAKVFDKLAADKRRLSSADLAGLKLASLRDCPFRMNKDEIKRILFDLPEGQQEYYPATSAGYCLRESNERSEWAAIKYHRIKTHIYLMNQFTPTNLEKNCRE